ncbi:PRC-barrel domain-containing protein [Roseovarius indicus]|uniref:PRC-barrel domain-containing protein n=1 Tax=Roseovarius indicus TaxID=540747 RepID=UPI000A3D9C7B
MNRLTTSTLALIVAASTAVADNHGDEEMTQSGASDSGQTEQDAGMSGDTDMSEDMSNAEDDGEMQTEASMTEGTKSADMNGMQGKLIRTRDITGGNIYTVNEANDEGWNPTTVHNEVGSDWNTIGEIEDVVLSQDGQVTGIVAEVGGFLDIADKHVLISIDDLNLVAVDDATYGYVTRQNEEDLEELESVDEGFWN